MLELKIGALEDQPRIEKEQFGGWRFIVTKRDNALLLYAAAVPKENAGAFGHAAVVDKYKAIDILGGGDFLYSYGDFEIKGMSGNFGCVPNGVMKQFLELMKDDLNKKYRINEFKLDMHIPESKQDHEKWKKLGYEF